MLTAAQFDELSTPIVELYRRYEDAVIRDIARRLAKTLQVTQTAAWQVQRLSESGLLYEEILGQLSQLTGQSETVLRQMFQRAGVKALRFDDSIYKAAGLEPLPLNLSPAMTEVLAAGLRKTQGMISNLTQTTAIAGQHAFTDAADLAYMQISTGAFDYQSALRQAVKEMAAKGLTMVQYAGRQDHLDVAIRRAVLTGIGQTTGELQWRRADEMGQDLVQVTAHAGARNTGTGPANHESWQGKVYSRSGSSRKYPNFIERTGYGTGAGLLGWNCRHHYFPFFEGISENAYEQATLDEFADRKVTYNGQEMNFYDATQQQRAIERKIRHWKRQAGALEAAGLPADTELSKVREWQARMRDFTRQTKLVRQRERERVIIVPEIEKLSNINFSSDRVDLIGKTSDNRNYYSFSTPGREFMLPSEVQLTPKRKKHILEAHSEQISWLETQTKLIRETLLKPDFMDATPFKNNGRWAVTYVKSLENESLDLLVVGVRHGKSPGQISDILTIFLADNRFVFDAKGRIKPRWMSIK